MNIWVFCLESIETRYTAQWIDSIPNEINEIAKKQNKKVNVINVLGEQRNSSTTEGAFLNFIDTNIWKSTQLVKFCEHIDKGDVKDGDQILFADAWNPCILQVKYMVDLLGFKNIKLHGILHAGQYDPQDFLGRLIKTDWPYFTEQAMVRALDYTYFATKYHLNLFANAKTPEHKIGLDLGLKSSGKLRLSGQPHSKLIEDIQKVGVLPKKDIILFPHRKAPEKQLDIFLDLKASMPQYEFIVCMDHKLTKQEYYRMMSEAKMVFSANLQETLGISAMEAVLLKTIPFVPDRLSYSEMYLEEFMYLSEWTESFDAYIQNKQAMIWEIERKMNNYSDFDSEFMIQEQSLKRDYLTAEKMIINILGD